jgi:hypothetical protein
MKRTEKSKNLLNSYIHAEIEDMKNREILKHYYNEEIEKVINQIEERGDYPYNRDVENEFIKQNGEVENKDFLGWLVYETQHYVEDKRNYEKSLEIDKQSIDEGFKYKDDFKEFKEGKFYNVRRVERGDFCDKVCKYRYLKSQTPKDWFMFKNCSRTGWHIDNELYIKEVTNER